MVSKNDVVRVGAVFQRRICTMLVVQGVLRAMGGIVNGVCEPLRSASIIPDCFLKLSLTGLAVNGQWNCFRLGPQEAGNGAPALPVRGYTQMNLAAVSAI